MKSKKRMFWKKNAVFDAKFGVDTSKFYRNLEFGASAFGISPAASSTTRATEDFQLTQRFEHRTAEVGWLRLLSSHWWLAQVGLVCAARESRWTKKRILLPGSWCRNYLTHQTEFRTVKRNMPKRIKIWNAFFFNILNRLAARFRKSNPKRSISG